MNDELQLPRAARVFVSFAALLRANHFAVAPEQTTAQHSRCHHALSVENASAR